MSATRTVTMPKKYPTTFFDIPPDIRQEIFYLAFITSGLKLCVQASLDGVKNAINDNADELQASSSKMRGTHKGIFYDHKFENWKVDNESNGIELLSVGQSSCRSPMLIKPHIWPNPGPLRWPPCLSFPKDAPLLLRTRLYIFPSWVCSCENWKTTSSEEHEYTLLSTVTAVNVNRILIEDVIYVLRKLIRQTAVDVKTCTIGRISNAKAVDDSMDHAIVAWAYRNLPHFLGAWNQIALLHGSHLALKVLRHQIRERRRHCKQALQTLELNTRQNQRRTNQHAWLVTKQMKRLEKGIEFKPGKDWLAMKQMEQLETGHEFRPRQVCLAKKKTKRLEAGHESKPAYAR